MSGIMSLLGGNSGGGGGGMGGGMVSNMMGNQQQQQPSILSGMLRSGMSGSMNQGFGGQGQNLFSSMLGDNLVGNTLDTLDRSGSLFRSSQQQLPSLPQMASQSPLIYSLRRR